MMPSSSKRGFFGAKWVFGANKRVFQSLYRSVRTGGKGKSVADGDAYRQVSAAIARPAAAQQSQKRARLLTLALSRLNNRCVVYGLTGIMMWA
jgi:hypothetical protein